MVGFALERAVLWIDRDERYRAGIDLLKPMWMGYFSEPPVADGDPEKIPVNHRSCNGGLFSALI